MWHTETELPRLNLRSSKNWRIFVLQVKPEKEITLRQVCRRGEKYTLIQGSAVKTLTFDNSVIGIVVPPDVSFQQLISPLEDGEVISVVAKSSAENTKATSPLVMVYLPSVPNLFPIFRFWVQMMRNQKRKLERMLQIVGFMTTGDLINPLPWITVTKKLFPSVFFAPSAARHRAQSSRE